MVKRPAALKKPAGSPGMVRAVKKPAGTPGVVRSVLKKPAGSFGMVRAVKRPSASLENENLRLIQPSTCVSRRKGERRDEASSSDSSAEVPHGPLWRPSGPPVPTPAKVYPPVPSFGGGSAGPSRPAVPRPLWRPGMVPLRPPPCGRQGHQHLHIRRREGISSSCTSKSDVVREGTSSCTSRSEAVRDCPHPRPSGKAAAAAPPNPRPSGKAWTAAPPDPTPSGKASTAAPADPTLS